VGWVPVGCISVLGPGWGGVVNWLDATVWAATGAAVGLVHSVYWMHPGA
jgi:hypothetical protein